MRKEGLRNVIGPQGSLLRPDEKPQHLFSTLPTHAGLISTFHLTHTRKLLLKEGTQTVGTMGKICKRSFVHSVRDGF